MADRNQKFLNPSSSNYTFMCLKLFALMKVSLKLLIN